MPLPQFTADGVLPPGDYAMTLDELPLSMLVTGPSAAGDPDWDSEWRLQLVTNLRVMAQQLWSVGIDEIFIDGSFVEDKNHPNDIDGYFGCDPKWFASGELERDLNLIDPHKCWTWDHSRRRAYRGYVKRQLPMWHAYRVELYPHFAGLIAAKDEHGHPLEFPAFFRKRRESGNPKGIIQIVKP